MIFLKFILILSLLMSFAFCLEENKENTEKTPNLSRTFTPVITFDDLIPPCNSQSKDTPILTRTGTEILEPDSPISSPSTSSIKKRNSSLIGVIEKSIESKKPRSGGRRKIIFKVQFTDAAIDIADDEKLKTVFENFKKAHTLPSLNIAKERNKFLVELFERVTEGKQWKLSSEELAFLDAVYKDYISAIDNELYRPYIDEYDEAGLGFILSLYREKRKPVSEKKPHNAITQVADKFSSPVKVNHDFYFLRSLEAAPTKVSPNKTGQRNVYEALFAETPEIAFSERCLRLTMDKYFKDGKPSSNLEDSMQKIIAELSQRLNRVVPEKGELNVHHLERRPEGPMLSLPKTLHSKFYGILHPQIGRSLINRAEFKEERGIALRLWALRRLVKFYDYVIEKNSLIPPDAITPAIAEEMIN